LICAYHLQKPSYTFDHAILIFWIRYAAILNDVVDDLDTGNVNGSGHWMSTLEDTYDYTTLA
jgi:hypothetical protein